MLAYARQEVLLRNDWRGSKLPRRRRMLEGPIKENPEGERKMGQ